MINNLNQTTIVREARDLRDLDRMSAYQSMQKTQNHWAQTKQTSNDSVEREGVSVTISQAAKSKIEVLERTPDVSAITKSETMQVDPTVSTTIQPVSTANLTVIMNRMRELSVESTRDQLPETTRDAMFKEMKKLLEEAERISKQSRANLQGLVMDPNQFMRMQRATEAFQAQKKMAPQPVAQTPLPQPVALPVTPQTNQVQTNPLVTASPN